MKSIFDNMSKYFALTLSSMYPIGIDNNNLHVAKTAHNTHTIRVFSIIVSIKILKYISGHSHRPKTKRKTLHAICLLIGGSSCIVSFTFFREFILV
jgi:hypothetical protein